MADMIVRGVHGCSREDRYVYPTDPLIRQRLEWFKDQKLALMIHYGPYSQLGVSASWSLSDGDASWSRAAVDWETDSEAYRRQYVDQYKTFNPVRFQPDKWAQFAYENGFRYLIFTTKHHDGFCMFDTQYTDYKITSPKCPFHNHKFADFTRELFDAFRRKGLAIAAYFSKPDWHCPWYWAENMKYPVAHHRDPTYIPGEHPEIWEKFAEFTKNQILELVRNYGKIDILWLDGAQVNPKNGQDIHLSDIITESRKIQPWLITVDRAIGGENENYITPEQSIPDRIIRVPWESCITLGTQWGYKYCDTYKTSHELIHILINVVSRGGNLALNIGPQPNGELPADALHELEGLGSWLKVNGEAIYGTRPADNEHIGNVFFTKKDNLLYAMVLLDCIDILTGEIFIPVNYGVEKVVCLVDLEELNFKKLTDGICVTLSRDFPGDNYPAVVFRIE